MKLANMDFRAWISRSFRAWISHRALESTALNTGSDPINVILQSFLEFRIS